MRTKTLYLLSHKILMTVALLLASVSIASAQYSLYTSAGDVKIKRAGKEIPVEAEMKITSADRFILGSNASVQILNARDSRLYKCDTPGEHTLSGILLDAESESNSSAIHRRLRISKADAQEGTMYVEKGKVTRALDTFDPAAVNVQIDPASLARFVYRQITEDTPGTCFPASIVTVSNDSVMSFDLRNNLQEPIYINVITYTDAKKGDFNISHLGQPVGSYVLLPNQSISRAQYRGATPGHKHMIIATDYYFSIDELIEHLTELKDEPATTTVISSSMPVYLKSITE